MRDQVVSAVLAGVKTTTSGLALGYERSGEPLLMCGVLRIAEIDLRHVLDDGDESVAQWRSLHEEYWQSAEMREVLGEPGFIVDDETEVLAQRFHLVSALLGS